MAPLADSSPGEAAMEIRSTLIAISNDARGWLHAWARDFAESEAREGGAGRPNPIAWHLGHLATVEDDVHRLFAGGDRHVPESLRAACGSGCPPPTAATRDPSLAELWALLEATHARLLALVQRSSDADFDRPPREENRFFTSLGQAVYEAALHENYHVGEIGALRKALGKKSIG
jgi:hypothetical protein